MINVYTSGNFFSHKYKKNEIVVILENFDNKIIVCFSTNGELIRWSFNTFHSLYEII